MNKQEVIAMLDNSGIEYEITEHIPVYTIEEMMNIGLPYPEKVAKNLFVRDDKKRNYYLITVKEEKRVNLKEFQEKIGSRKLSFASENDLNAILGLSAGSVTPFGVLNDGELKVQVYFDSDFKGEKIGIHPNENTATVWINTDDIKKIVEQHGNDFKFIDM